MATGQRWVTFGILGRPHGVRGEIRLYPYESNGELPEGLSSVRLISKSGIVRSEKIGTVRWTSNAYLVKFENINGRDAASSVVNSRFEIPFEQLPDLDEGEFFLFELIGSEVLNEAGKSLGIAKKIISAGRNELLSIEGDAGELLLPLVSDIIIRFHRDESRLIVRPPPGLEQGVL
ncbi:16S rRNA processing protein RimM [Myxococcota bacterium]|nr:16S rRNA processing protein RimM [Myxococcota bacterium]